MRNVGVIHPIALPVAHQGRNEPDPPVRASGLCFNDRMKNPRFESLASGNRSGNFSLNGQWPKGVWRFDKKTGQNTETGNSTSES